MIMKKILRISYCLILITCLCLVLNKNTFVYAHDGDEAKVNHDVITEEMLEKMEKNEGKIDDKILKYDVATKTTTEVDMKEVEDKLTKIGKGNIESTSSYSVPTYSYSIANMNNFLTPYFIRDDEPNLDISKFSLIKNAYIQPYICNCRIIIDGGREIGTGTLVGSNILLTAAHCVMDVDDPNHFSFQDWHAYPGFHGYSYKVDGKALSAGVVSYYYSNEWNKTEENQYDWCVCVLDEAIGTKTGWAGCTVYSDNNLKDLHVKEYGYPWSVLDSKYQMYTEGYVETVKTNYMINSAICAKGMSGGPIQRASDNTVVGVISGYKEPNAFVQDYRTIGVRINQNIIRTIENLKK